MFKPHSAQETVPRSTEMREGDLYRRVELFGKSFELRYGYYEDRDRSGPPDIIYPNFIDEPIYTGDGRPFVTMMQDACTAYAGRVGTGEDIACGDCKHFERGEEWLGVCTCSKNRLRE